MKNYGEAAKQYFLQGYNCCQAVVLAFLDDGADEREKSELMKIASSFGGGFGRLREICGAVSAMGVVAGLKCGYEDDGEGGAKANHYKLIQELANEFKAENGSIICRELLGLDKAEGGYTPDKRTAEYYKARPCADKVKSAADIIAERLFKE